MAVKRGKDGQPYEELTKIIGGSRGSSAKAKTESATQPLRRNCSNSSLGGAGRSMSENPSFETPTALLRTFDDATRIISLGKRNTASDRAQTKDPMADPPVGWLVVIRGPGKGSALSVGNGMNAIGRGENSRIRVDFGDDGVSRNNHARIAYEPVQRCFLLSHGEGSNLTYLNGKVVMDTKRIASGDEIQMGGTTFRFQSFCSEKFDWPDVDD
ncbi:MAG: FHA domain-containing protein [Aestuariivita sp.]|nr:FHA domain-containing protein [Aestuariivita sp.]